MTNQTLQTICQYIIAIGLFSAAIGGLGTYIFGQKVQREKEAEQAFVGRLQTEQRIILSANQKLYPKLEFGDSGSILVYTGPEGSPLFKIAEDNNLTIELEDRQVKITTRIRDRNGQIAADILKNEWKINPNNSWDRNYSKNALEVKDPAGDIVLQVRLIEDRIQFQAKLYDATGRGIGIGKVLGPNGWGGAIELTGPNRPKLTIKIQPIFKYPSRLHLGEFIGAK
jgi:hypothetical protein